MRKRILFDNNSIDKVSEHLDEYKKLKKKIDFFVCATVIAELADIPDSKKEVRLKRLLSFVDIEARLLPDACFIWGYSIWGNACWGAGKVYESILNEKGGNIKDAIIAETAVKNNCVLLTNDKTLYKRMKDHGYDVISHKELMAQYKCTLGSDTHE